MMNVELALTGPSHKRQGYGFHVEGFETQMDASGGERFRK
jgi:hypothetical protein